MTANKLIFDIKEAIKEYSDDSEIDGRYILYLYGIKRAKYIRRELNSMQRAVDVNVQQTICLEMELTTAEECNIGFSCKSLLKSKKEIPDTISLHTKNAIIRVAPSDKLSKPFDFTTREKVIYSKNSSFPNSIYSFLHDDNHIYLVSESESLKLLECISVTGIFEDPLELEKYSNCCGCTATESPCFDYNTIDYPIPTHLIDIIREEIILDLLRSKKIIEDKDNDSNNEK